MKKNFLSIALLIGALQLAPIEAMREKKDRKEGNSSASRSRRVVAQTLDADYAVDEEEIGYLDQDSSITRDHQQRRRSAPTGSGYNRLPNKIEIERIGLVDPIGWETAERRSGEEIARGEWPIERYESSRTFERMSLEEVVRDHQDLLREFSNVACLKYIIKNIQQKVRIFTEEEMSKQPATKRKSRLHLELTMQEEETMKLMLDLQHISSKKSDRWHGKRPSHGPAVEFRRHGGEDLQPSNLRPIDRRPAHRTPVEHGPVERRQEDRLGGEKRPVAVEQREPREKRIPTERPTAARTRPTEPTRMSETRTVQAEPSKRPEEEVRRKVAAPAPTTK